MLDTTSTYVQYLYFYANYIVFFLVFRSVSPGSNSVKRRRRKRRSLTEVQFNVVAKSHKPDSLSSTAKVILYVNEETLPIAASTENSGKEPKRIQGFTKSRILQKKPNLKSNLDIYTYLYLGEILAICDNAMSSIFTFYNSKSIYKGNFFSCVSTRDKKFDNRK